MSVTSSEGDPQSDWSERTLAIIKPEAYEDEDAIKDIILSKGFQILAERHIRLTPEQVADFYVCHYGNIYFPHIVAHLSNKPIIALCLAKKNAIEEWRQLMGPSRVAEAQAYWPDSVRACFGRKNKYGDYFNAVHGSETNADAVRELHFFFPQMIVGPILRKLQCADYLQRHINPTLLEGLTELAKAKPEQPIVWLAEWLLAHDPDEPAVTANLEDEEQCKTPPDNESE